ncbi:AlkA N-terminal domain-containing protein [Gallaecimonas kandeliae]|uniref:AlkA N-terminal domain-containing protein n=1 Tax=Gallaecimonas kandeliae TaxID=3029055 RepID=UPI002648F09D|nr:AlkA N-terminal domain-containing protein [Gallaecimonas kandeliae]WKE64464.1 AlkA N-terminal domain-containing protein [Gallaecimonas kandeliae]
MKLDDAACYQALVSRDARFDGRFFAGVLSTGIYCRPVCPARKPLADNCRFFSNAAAAEAAGFRPCMKCRPERAPGLAWSDGKERLAQKAEQLIKSGDFTSLEALAERLGVTDRHLRRTFHETFGISPVAYAQTQRLLLAKKLLSSTQLPVTQVAMASGFGSLRRMNSLFAERYGLSPSRLRAQAPKGEARFHLGFRPPFAWHDMLAFLAGRAIEGVELIGGESYSRTVRLSYQGQWHKGWLKMQKHAERPELIVTLSDSLLMAVPPVLAGLRHLFDLDADPTEIKGALGGLAAANPGLRVPGAFDGLEMAVRAILGQQVTVAAARTLAGRLAAQGEPCQDAPAGLSHYFPDAEALLALGQDKLGELGVIRSRGKAICALAAAMIEGLELGPAAEPEPTIKALEALPGIGPWTASYIAMRALHWPDAWPYGDHGLKVATGLADPKALAGAMAPYSPWRAYATLHLWSTL